MTWDQIGKSLVLFVVVLFVAAGAEMLLDGARSCGVEIIDGR